MINVEQAIDLLTAATPQLTQTEEVPLLDALGRVLADDAVSPIGVPRFPKAAMDGYALKSADSIGASREHPVTLRVVCEIDAGDWKPCDCAPFTAARIMTGGAIPLGYDCVIKQEDTDCGEKDVALYKLLSPGENYIPAEEDIRLGQLVIPRRTRLTPEHIGVLASMGFSRVRLLRPLRVGFIATGSELAQPGSALLPAQVYDSNSYVIASYLKAAGVELSFFEICPDEPARFEALIRACIDNTDVILTTGGVSVGRRDFVESSLKSLGAELLFSRVRMKPGTPVLAASYCGKPILCLSGSPFAAVVNFHVFFWPLLAHATVCASYLWRRGSFVLREGAMKPSGLRRFVRARLGQDGVYLYTASHGASVLSSLPGFNCMIDQAAGVALSAGDVVDVLWPEG